MLSAGFCFFDIALTVRCFFVRVVYSVDFFIYHSECNEKSLSHIEILHRVQNDSEMTAIGRLQAGQLILSQIKEE